MPVTRRTVAAKQEIMDGMYEELGEENLALAKVIEKLMRKFFEDADERSEARVKRLEQRIDTMNNTLTRHTESIKSLRSDTVKLQHRVTNTEKSTVLCMEKLRACEDKLIQMEDRARRDNLLIFNVKEGAESGNALAYLTRKIPKWFPAFASAPPELMRCHRLGPLRAPAPGNTRRPRPLIAKCLRYTDRDRLLNEARENPPEEDGIQLKFAADYSSATTERRKPCYKVMHKARNMGLKAFLLYPATIKLTRGSEIHLFEEPSKAENFLASINASGIDQDDADDEEDTNFSDTGNVTGVE